MLSPKNNNEEFEFYLKFAKPLVLNLSEANDRIKAAAWIKKLRDDPTQSHLRTDYLKLLLFVLQKRRLLGPFSEAPDNATLKPFPPECNLQNMAKNFVELDRAAQKEILERAGCGDWPPYSVAYSSDLTEYAATQTIPNFGIQAFLAISKDPIPAWTNVESALIPKSIKASFERQEWQIGEPHISPDNISCFVKADMVLLTPSGGDGFVASAPTPAAAEEQKRSSSFDDKSVKFRDDKKGQEDEEEDDSFYEHEKILNQMMEEDDRIPPSWGSNLISVTEAPQPMAKGRDEDQIERAEMLMKELEEGFITPGSTSGRRQSQGSPGGSPMTFHELPSRSIRSPQTFYDAHAASGLQRWRNRTDLDMSYDDRRATIQRTPPSRYPADLMSPIRGVRSPGVGASPETYEGRYEWLDRLGGGPGLPESSFQEGVSWHSQEYYDQDALYQYAPPTPPGPTPSEVFGGRTDIWERPMGYRDQRRMGDDWEGIEHFFIAPEGAERDLEYLAQYPPAEATPPPFSKFRRIREGYAEEYAPEQFGLAGDVEWVPGEQFMQGLTEAAMTQVDRRRIGRTSPMPIPKSPKLATRFSIAEDDIDKMEAMWNETEPPAMEDIGSDLDVTIDPKNFLIDLELIDARLPLTTPKRSTSPQRTAEDEKIFDLSEEIKSPRQKSFFPPTRGYDEIMKEIEEKAVVSPPRTPPDGSPVMAWTYQTPPGLRKPSTRKSPCQLQRTESGSFRSASPDQSMDILSPGYPAVKKRDYFETDAGWPDDDLYDEEFGFAEHYVDDGMSPITSPLQFSPQSPSPRSQPSPRRVSSPRRVDGFSPIQSPAMHTPVPRTARAPAGPKDDIDFLAYYREDDDMLAKQRSPDLVIQSPPRPDLDPLDKVWQQELQLQGSKENLFSAFKGLRKQWHMKRPKGEAKFWEELEVMPRPQPPRLSNVWEVPEPTPEKPIKIVSPVCNRPQVISSEPIDVSKLARHQAEREREEAEMERMYAAEKRAAQERRRAELGPEFLARIPKVEPIQLESPKSPLIRTPRRYILDESIREELPDALIPNYWGYKTPPKLADIAMPSFMPPKTTREYFDDWSICGAKTHDAIISPGGHGFDYDSPPQENIYDYSPPYEDIELSPFARPRPQLSPIMEEIEEDDEYDECMPCSPKISMKQYEAFTSPGRPEDFDLFTEDIYPDLASPPPPQIKDPFDRAWKQEIDLHDETKIPFQAPRGLKKKWWVKPPKISKIRDEVNWDELEPLPKPRRKPSRQLKRIKEKEEPAEEFYDIIPSPPFVHVEPRFGSPRFTVEPPCRPCSPTTQEGAAVSSTTPGMVSSPTKQSRTPSPVKSRRTPSPTKTYRSSSPSPELSPPPPRHILDESIPDIKTLPKSLIPPEYWGFRTPPKYKNLVIPQGPPQPFTDYFDQHDITSPEQYEPILSPGGRGMEFEKYEPPDVDLFKYSPPREEMDFSILSSPQERSPRVSPGIEEPCIPCSPVRSPPLGDHFGFPTGRFDESDLFNESVYPDLASPPPAQINDPLDRAWKQEIDLHDETKVPFQAPRGLKKKWWVKPPKISKTPDEVYWDELEALQKPRRKPSRRLKRIKEKEEPAEDLYDIIPSPPFVHVEPRYGSPHYTQVEPPCQPCSPTTGAEATVSSSKRGTTSSPGRQTRTGSPTHRTPSPKKPAAYRSPSPSPEMSPPPPRHILDESIPDIKTLPKSLIPPEYWAFRTPPKYKNLNIPQHPCTCTDYFDQHGNVTSLEQYDPIVSPGGGRIDYKQYAPPEEDLFKYSPPREKMELSLLSSPREISPRISPGIEQPCIPCSPIRSPPLRDHFGSPTDRFDETDFLNESMYADLVSPPPAQIKDPFDRAWKQEIDLHDETKVPFQAPKGLKKKWWVKPPQVSKTPDEVFWDELEPLQKPRRKPSRRLKKIKEEEEPAEDFYDIIPSPPFHHVEPRYGSPRFTAVEPPCEPCSPANVAEKSASPIKSPSPCPCRPSSPVRTPSPSPEIESASPRHILDESIPDIEGLPKSMVPPHYWEFRTPTKYKDIVVPQGPPKMDRGYFDVPCGTMSPSSYEPIVSPGGRHLDYQQHVPEEEDLFKYSPPREEMDFSTFSSPREPSPRVSLGKQQPCIPCSPIRSPSLSDRFASPKRHRTDFDLFNEDAYPDLASPPPAQIKDPFDRAWKQQIELHDETKVAFQAPRGLKKKWWIKPPKISKTPDEVYWDELEALQKPRRSPHKQFTRIEEQAEPAQDYYDIIPSPPFHHVEPRYASPHYTAEPPCQPCSPIKSTQTSSPGKSPRRMSPVQPRYSQSPVPCRSRSPTPEPSPVSPRHILDESIPDIEGLPKSLVPPHYWGFRTPPQYKNLPMPQFPQPNVDYFEDSDFETSPRHYEPITSPGGGRIERTQFVPLDENIFQYTPPHDDVDISFTASSPELSPISSYPSADDSIQEPCIPCSFLRSPMQGERITSPGGRPVQFTEPDFLTEEMYPGLIESPPPPHIQDPFDRAWRQEVDLTDAGKHSFKNPRFKPRRSRAPRLQQIREQEEPAYEMEFHGYFPDPGMKKPVETFDPENLARRKRIREVVQQVQPPVQITTPPPRTPTSPITPMFDVPEDWAYSTPPEYKITTPRRRTPSPSPRQPTPPYVSPMVLSPDGSVCTCSPITSPQAYGGYFSPRPNVHESFMTPERRPGASPSDEMVSGRGVIHMETSHRAELGDTTIDFDNVADIEYQDIEEEFRTMLESASPDSTRRGSSLVVSPPHLSFDEETDTFNWAPLEVRHFGGTPPMAVREPFEGQGSPYEGRIYGELPEEERGFKWIPR